MIKKLIGCMNTTEPLWSNFDTLMVLISSTSPDNTPNFLSVHCMRGAQKVWPDRNFSLDLGKIWIVLKNGEITFIASNQGDYHLSEPEDVSDEMFEFLSNKWFCTSNDFYAFNNNKLFSLKMVSNYIVENMRNGYLSIPLLVKSNGKEEIKTSMVSLYARSWALYFMLNYREKLSEVVSDVGMMQNLITLETSL